MKTNLLQNKTELVDDCHLFIGCKDRDGYGLININGKTTRAHRYSYEIYNGDLPKNCVIHHTCHRRNCVNPAHLQAITPQSNIAEMLERQNFIQRILELETELTRSNTLIEKQKELIDELETTIETLTNEDDFLEGDC